MYPSFDEGSLYYTDVRVLIYKSGGSFQLKPKVWFICPHRFGEGINHSLRNESIRTAGKTLARQTEHGASLSDSAAEKPPIRLLYSVFSAVAHCLQRRRFCLFGFYAHIWVAFDGRECGTTRELQWVGRGPESAELMDLLAREFLMVGLTRVCVL